MSAKLSPNSYCIIMNCWWVGFVVQNSWATKKILLYGCGRPLYPASESCTVELKRIWMQMIWLWWSWWTIIIHIVLEGKRSLSFQHQAGWVERMISLGLPTFLLVHHAYSSLSSSCCCIWKIRGNFLEHRAYEM